ncbi:hypothetical protein [Veillonella agrestimuris]|uniref:hypothetical protein n=1 Tax=Veillonella agrestimuris TaxID=2941340 RepID=UPI00203BB886|nr:hypothetical protein [Veillonella agrestimuris]
MTGAQTAAGATVAAKSTQGLGNDISLLAKTENKSSGIIQKGHMDISPIKDRVSKEQYKKMESNDKFDNHKVFEYGPNHRSLPIIGAPNSSLDLIENNVIKQRRYYGKDGKPVVDIDFFHSGDYHTFPHKHIWSEELPNGRSKHEMK